jgi:hypothetical protein
MSGNVHIGVVMVSLLASNDGGVFVALPLGTLSRNSKYWLAQNRNNVAEWSDIFPYQFVFQWPNTVHSNSAKHVGLVHIECTLFSPWYGWNIVYFGVKQQSLTDSIKWYIPLCLHDGCQDETGYYSRTFVCYFKIN